MLKNLFIILFLSSNLYSSEYDQFKNTEFYVTYNHNGKPALLLGETYKRQTGKEMKDLVGKTFKFLFDDGTLKDAKIEKLEKICYIFKDIHIDDIPDEQLCSYIGTQNQLTGFAIGAFLTDLSEFKFEWVFKPKWKEVDKIDMVKVRENIARNGGVGYETKVGESIRDFEQVKSIYAGGPPPIPKSIEDIIISSTGPGRRNFTSQGRVWEVYGTFNAWVVLNQGEIFYVGVDGYGEKEFDFVFDGVVSINNVNFYYLRFGRAIYGYEYTHKQFEDPLDVAKFLPMLAFVGTEKKFEEGIKLALHPCVSKLFTKECKYKLKSSSHLFYSN